MAPFEKEQASTKPSDGPSDASEADAVSLEIDPVSERRLLRKLDLRIVPFMLLIYTLSMLDRVNLGNAVVAGMTEELELNVGDRFNKAFVFFYITYIILEIPSNMLLKMWRPEILVSIMMFCWGIVCMCEGFVNNFNTLLALRLLLGVFEAGVLPALIFIIPLYYRRNEVAIRLGIIMASPIIAGAFGGLLAYAIAGLSGASGYLGWRWIFIIEGAVTSFIALAGPFVLVGYPESTRFLSQEERELINRRKRLDNVGQVEYRMDVLNKFTAKLIFLDPKIWLSAFAFLGLGVSGLITFQFLPTILQEFGWVGRDAQIYSVPVYMVGLVLACSWSWLSDRFRGRIYWIWAGQALCVAGYIMLVQQERLGLSKNAKYGAAFLIPSGGFMSTFIILSWPTANQSGHWKRSIGAAIQICVGGVSGPITSYIFLQRERPYFKTGFAAGLGLSLFGLLSATLLTYLWHRENRLRDEGKRDYLLELPEDQVNNLGDDHPHFRFSL